MFGTRLAAAALVLLGLASSSPCSAQETIPYEATPEGMCIDGSGMEAEYPLATNMASSAPLIARPLAVYPDCPTLATERLPFASFEIDSATPGKYFRVRYDAGWGYDRPDRSEYFWPREGASGGTGPALAESNVDYQDVRFYYENGAGPISFFIDLPIRSVDPEVNPDTTGFGDMNLGAKSILCKKGDFTLSTIFRTYIPTGNRRKGLGTGHVSLEPGLLANYRFWEKTLFFGEFKYYFPIGGDPDWAGGALRYGFGASHVLWQSECKSFAITPVLEFVGWTVLDGRATLPSGGFENVDGLWIYNVQPGVRMMIGPKVDVGVSGAWAITDAHWYDSLVRLDLRWFF